MAKSKSERRVADEREERDVRVDETLRLARHHRAEADASMGAAKKAMSAHLSPRRRLGTSNTVDASFRTAVPSVERGFPGRAAVARNFPMLADATICQRRPSDSVECLRAGGD